MPKYRFEVQNLIYVTIEDDNAEDARCKLMDNLSEYSDEMISDCYISDGDELKGGE